MARGLKEDAPYADFAKRLRQLRRDRKMTRIVFAEKCGLVPATVLNYENGIRIPAADMAVKMAEVLDITVGELMGVEKNEDMKRTEAAINRIRDLYGNKKAKQAEEMLKNAETLFAGGDLPPEAQEDYILEMQKLFIFATEKAREKFTPKKYRTEERIAASRERLREIDAIDEQIMENNKKNKHKHPLLDTETWGELD